MTTKRTQRPPIDIPCGEQQVVEYLRAHPEFFEHQPELLTQLRVPHPSGRAISLIERLVENLREQLEQERTKMTLLIELANENQVLAERLHRLTLALIEAEDRVQTERVLQQQLQQEFSADGVELKLYSATQVKSLQKQPENGDQDPVLASFMGFLLAAQTVCGPLEPEQVTHLFAAQGEEIRSTALIPLRAGDLIGLLAIGSREATRFHPEMGTEFLTRLGEVLSHKLQTVVPNG